MADKDRWSIIQPRQAGPEARPVPEVSGEISDKAIGEAIQRGVDFLIGEFDTKTFLLREGTQGNGRRAERNGYLDGADVLCVYALMQCGEAINDQRLSMHGTFLPGCFDAMKALPLNDRFATYSRAVCAQPPWPITTARKTTRY